MDLTEGGWTAGDNLTAAIAWGRAVGPQTIRISHDALARVTPDRTAHLRRPAPPSQSCR
ncbi:hypothetical protein ACFQVD_01205 [Streptosporangium amethystogenes subsp. fukuiense]|uniref:Uncharacterized protein n=1 Tax=Streptosporangium amethystogenes subsp. fukuiense TaxID=698418 RepID=A0ABW2SRQ2_9ACTN